MYEPTHTNPVESYKLDATKVMASLHTPEGGLSDAEVAKRLTHYGYNVLQKVHKEHWIYKFFRQFRDLMIVLLLGSGAISIYLKDYRTAVILFIIVFLNASIGFYQEHKAENIMASLEKLVVPRAKVRRDGKLTEIDSAEIVPGDIIYIEEGDSVPIDGRIIQETELSTNDFALTGESNPSRKFDHPINGTVELAVRHNLVFMGTTVATGEGLIVVTGTGMQTELGRIASLSQETKSDLSPLQKEMNHLARRLTQGTLVLAGILLLIALKVDLSIKESFIFAIGIASAMVPQGLPASVNITLTQAAGKLAKAKALVKKLSAVETLGATSIILTDKTGTLTKNEMTVEQLLIGLTPYWVSGGGYEANGVILDKDKQPLAKNVVTDLSLFFITGVFASNASINPPDDEHATWYCLGDPTEGALITLGRKANFDVAALNKEHPELREFPFDSVRKRMSSVREYDHHSTVFVKGAPESVLEVATHIIDDGKKRPITDKDKKFILARNDMLAGAAMRNLAYACKILPDDMQPKTMTMQDAETELTLLGMVSMIDPPREEIPEAMRAAAGAHIPVSIITGDNALTAKAIAIKAGLASTADELIIVVGDQLHSMSDNDIIKLITRGKVIFSRVAPEDKLRIVQLGKSVHRVVAVTGDGINDAPALKRADIGVAMGKTGTDVAKQSAEIVLLDDSFHTLVGAIQEGRVIYRNIKKIAIANLSGNTAELFTVLISLFAVSAWKIPIAISAVQILAIDLMAELFPIAALGWDPPESELMTDAPRNLNHHIINFSSGVDLALSGLLMGTLAYANYLLYFYRHGFEPHNFSTINHAHVYAVATTLTYITICLCQFANIMLRRIGHRKWVFSSYSWSNKKLLAAFGISLSGISLIAYNPIISRYMGSAGISLTDWLYALSAAAIYLCIRQFIKRYGHRRLAA